MGRSAEQLLSAFSKNYSSNLRSLIHTQDSALG
jgi:hypothetical protein